MCEVRRYCAHEVPAGALSSGNWQMKKIEKKNGASVEHTAQLLVSKVHKTVQQQ